MTAPSVPQQRQETQITPQRAAIGKLMSNAMRERILKVIPQYCEPDRFLSLAVSAGKALLSDPKVVPDSVVLAVFDAAKLGLYLDPQLHHAALVPYQAKNGWKYVQCQPEYRGMIHMARQCDSRLRDIKPYLVYRADEWKQWMDIDGPHFRHVPSTDSGREKSDIFGVYTLSWFEGEERPRFYFTPKEKVNRIEKMARRRGGAVWKDELSYPDMVLKTGIRQTLKWLDLSPEVNKAVSLDDEAATGRRVRQVEAEEIDGLIDADFRWPEDDQVPASSKPHVQECQEIVADEPAEKTEAQTAAEEIAEPDVAEVEEPENARGAFEERTLSWAKDAGLSAEQVDAMVAAEFDIVGGLGAVPESDFTRVHDHFMSLAEATH